MNFVEFLKRNKQMLKAELLQFLQPNQMVKLALLCKDANDLVDPEDGGKHLRIAMAAQMGQEVWPEQSKIFAHI